MFCPGCGKEVREGHMFCPGCGTDVRSEQSKPVSEERVERKPMREVRIYYKKEGIFGGGKVDFYVYLDNEEYKYSHKRKDPLVVKVTPEIHIIEVLTHKKTDKGIAGVAGAVLDLSSAIMTGFSKKQENMVMFDATDEEVINFKLTCNTMTGTVKVTEEY